MITDVKNGLFNIIVLYRLDRLSRSLKDLANLIEILDKHSVIIKSTSEDLDISSLSGRAMVQMLGVFAEFERGSIAERVAMGREQRARDGLYASPTRMFGYNYNKETKIYTINEPEALLVKEMFSLYSQGKGAYYLSRLFNKNGYKTINGKGFYKHFFLRAFKDGWYYCGKFSYTTKAGERLLIDAKNIPDPILTVDEFERANKIYAANAHDTAKKPTSLIFVFKGKLRCAECGNLYSTNISSPRKNKDGAIIKYQYYKCGRKQQGLCDGKHWIANKVNDEFVRFLKDFAKADTVVDVKLKGERLENLHKKKKVFEEKIDKGQAKKKRLQHLLLEDTLSKTEYLEIAKEIDESIKEAEEEINNILKEIETSKDADNLEHERQIALNIADSWNKLSFVQRKEFVNMFIKSIYLSRDCITKIEFIL